MSAVMVLAAASVVAACSDAGAGSYGSFRRPGSGSSTGSATNDSTESGGSSGTATTPSSSGSSSGGSSETAPAQPPADTGNDAGTSTKTPDPPAPGTCGNPKCVGGGGLCGCKAQDGDGNVVTLGCQDGQCACLSGTQVTSTFEGDCESGDDARGLFLGNCDCQ